ncbi:MAG TPA: efflux transporter periplasmic adaptor subunit, partial [Collimonas sp.]|nr:efflux transporter periplasmic adaptor subunit [Collimonas sp.]
MQTSTPLISHNAIAIAIGALVLITAATVTLSSRAAKPAAPPQAAASVSVAAVLEKTVTEWD